MTECSDIYQPFRMALVWPVIVGLMAAVVSTTISRNWNGSDAYWLAFTIGLRWMFRPFRGTDVRRLAAAILFAVAIPRLPWWQGTAIVYPLNLLSGEAFGWITLANSVALVLTARSWRLHWTGRTVALVAFVTWVLLAFATTSWTSRLIDITLAYAMFGEITAQRGRDV